MTLLNTYLIERIKPWMLPIAMVVGALFHDFFTALSVVIPYLVFFMQLAPYSRLTFHRLRLGRFHLSLLGIQVLGSLALYGLVSRFDPLVAQGVFVCILAPTATSAAVIAGMLGGSITTLATYCLLSNCTVALVAPLLFPWVGGQVAGSFGDSFLLIGRQLFPLLILPLVIALLLRKFTPRIHKKLQHSQQISFYLWSIALTIVIGKTVSFLLEQRAENYSREAWMAALALVVCGTQFLAGRRIGARYANRIAGGQGLGQKNTVLAIWMAQSYLDPITSIAPASYVLWQNLVNSWQLWRNKRRERQNG